jgi:hypothetical protein
MGYFLIPSVFVRSGSVERHNKCAKITDFLPEIPSPDIKNSVPLVGKRTLPTERPQLVGKVNANFSG